MNEDKLKSFLEIPYDRLEELNLKAKRQRAKKVGESEFEKEYSEYLKKEKRIKAVTLCFTDIEGRFHMLDYDKKYLLPSWENLTFDGSSIKGFSVIAESDLRIEPEWSTLRWLPADVFGPGKVLIFARILNRDFTPYLSDTRNLLRLYLQRLYQTKKYQVYLAPEVEGFLVEGVDAEQNFDGKQGFKLISTGGYFHSLPFDKLRLFIDRSAEAQRAIGFENEKDHPEVAPSQFELNFRFADALEICDEIQLYKLVCRQVANQMGMTATFLPKPIIGINGSGMHTNFSIFKNNKNLFYDKKGKDELSDFAWSFIQKILNHAVELSLIFDSSVNSYRRLDPRFEAPNEIRVSVTDRSSMIRIPIADEERTRIEVRAIAPDANPYLSALALVKTGLEGDLPKKVQNRRSRVRFLPSNIVDAIRFFKSSKLAEEIMVSDNKWKFAKLKEQVANRSPKELGTRVKTGEVVYHHEVTNQVLWNRF